MPARVSLKLVCVLAAAAFVVAFRLHAGGDAAPTATATTTTLSAAGAKALRADVAQPTATAVDARLAGAPGLPALHRAPARPKPRRAAVHAAAPPPAVTAAPTPVATPVPTAVATAAPVYVAPVHTQARPKYVGKSFDSKG
jgi:hypothetical protein